MKTQKKPAPSASIVSTDLIGGRLLISAPDAENGTLVKAQVNGEPWGEAVIADGTALLMGLAALPERYSVTLSLHPAALNSDAD